MDEIKRLAETDKIDSPRHLENKLLELKAKGYGILECIIYIRFNQECSLINAKSIVINSAAWIDQKEDFMQHQAEQEAEFFEAMKNDPKNNEKS